MASISARSGFPTSSATGDRTAAAVAATTTSCCFTSSSSRTLLMGRRRGNAITPAGVVTVALSSASTGGTTGLTPGQSRSRTHTGRGNCNRGSAAATVAPAIGGSSSAGAVSAPVSTRSIYHGTAEETKTPISKLRVSGAPPCRAGAARGTRKATEVGADAPAHASPVNSTAFSRSPGGCRPPSGCIFSGRRAHLGAGIRSAFSAPLNIKANADGGRRPVATPQGVILRT